VRSPRRGGSTLGLAISGSAVPERSRSLHRERSPPIRAGESHWLYRPTRAAKSRSPWLCPRAIGALVNERRESQFDGKCYFAARRSIPPSAELLLRSPSWHSGGRLTEKRTTARMGEKNGELTNARLRTRAPRMDKHDESRCSWRALKCR